MIAQDHPEAPIEIYRLAPLPIWVWYCQLCEWDNGTFDWQRTLADALNHLRTAHACPSMRASGEPCNDYCEDCGGKRWVGPKMTDQEFIAAVDCHDGLVEAFECGLSHKDLHADESQIYGAIETAHGLYTQLGGWVEEFELLRDEIEEKEDLK